MTIKEQIIEILKEVKQGSSLEGVTDIVEGGYLDSFELMALIAALTDTFDAEISVDDIAPENFNSIDAMAAMIERIKG